MPFHHGDLDQITRDIRTLVAAFRGDVTGQMFGDDLARQNPDHRGFGPVSRRAEGLRRDGPRLHRMPRYRWHDPPRGIGRVPGHNAATEHQRGMAAVQRVDHRNIGALAGRNQAPVLQPERLCRRQAGRAVHRQRRRAQGDGGADHVIKVPVFCDVQRVAVIGAEGQIGRVALGQDRDQRLQVLGDRPFADQHAQPLAQLFQCLICRRGLMLGADAGADIAVQVFATQKRRVAVDMAAPECAQLGQAAFVLEQNAGKIHELCQTDDTRMVHQRGKVRRRKMGPGGFHMGGRHAGRQLHADIHHGFGRGVQKVPDTVQTADIGNLVRVTDRGGDTARADAAVEFKGRDQRGFDMQMRVDEARHQQLAGAVDHLPPLIVSEHTHDGIAADRHIGVHQIAGDQVKHAPAAQHQIGGGHAPPLINQVGQCRSGHGGLLSTQ